MKSLLSVAIFSGFVLLAREFSPSRFPPTMTLLSNSKCIIKGNISYNSDRKLYHLPGMKDYEGTVIDKARGERWFCTESEAVKQGWRKAPR
ncbi:MAG: hypothetical protein AAFQ14_11270 [Cyanobacteria bacterium J06621_12]